MAVNVEELYAGDVSEIEGTEYHNHLQHAADVIGAILNKADEFNASAEDKEEIQQGLVSRYEDCENAAQVEELTQELQEKWGTEVAFKSNMSSIKRPTSDESTPGYPSEPTLRIISRNLG